MDTAALIVTVLGSVCLFLFGMKWMGSALQRLSGGPLRRALRSMTLSPGRSVLSGLYKHFVTDQIMDGGNMENPDYILHQHDGENAD